MKKEELQKGDIILFPPHDGDFIAKAIAFLTDGEVNHAALCYPGERELMIAESILKDGLVLNPFPEHIDKKYPLRICRMKSALDIEPLIKVAGKYLNESNAYPNFNLGMLGVLLLFKKFAPHTIKNHYFYLFMGLIASRLMKLVRERVYVGKHPMSCSQFVAQCFTDAGKDYDLHFDQLVVQFDSMQLSSGMTRTVENDMIAPIDLLSRNETVHLDNVDNFDLELKMSDEEAWVLTNCFIDILNDNEDIITCSTNTEIVSSTKLTVVLRSIVLSLYELCTGEKTENVNEAVSVLQSSTMRNYFVSPQDILKNSSSSLELIGLLSY